MKAEIRKRPAFAFLPAVLLACFSLSTASPAPPAALVRLPYLQNVQSDRASVLWTTDQPGTGSVVYSDGRSSKTAPAQVQAFPPEQTHLGTAFYQYRADLTGLAPGTTYNYAVTVDGQTLFPASSPSGAASFTTAGPGRFCFLVFGDSGAGTPEQAKLAQWMTAESGVNFVLHTGDLAYEEGTFDQFETRYFAVYARLMQRVAFFPTPGNHEYITDAAAPYLAVHALPDSPVPAADKGRYYSFDWSDAHFVSLDSNLLGTASESGMLAWMEHDLEQTARIWRIVYFHHAPYPSGHHLDDPICQRAREVVVPIAERHGAQLVLAGHEHSYQRLAPLAGGVPAVSGLGTTYIISGGGGGALQDIGHLPATVVALDIYHYLRADVETNQLTIRAIGLDGKEFDRVTIGPRRPPRTSGR